MEFFSSSSTEDLIRYFVILIVIVALSPYGVYILRMVIALATGGPRPYIRKRASAVQSIMELETAARTRIHDFAERNAELEYEISLKDQQIDVLSRENEALKDLIRSMENGEDRTSEPEAPRNSPSGSRDPDLEVFGFDPSSSPIWQDIKAAHRRAVKENHPDAGGDGSKIHELTEAYQRLKVRYGIR